MGQWRVTKQRTGAQRGAWPSRMQVACKGTDATKKVAYLLTMRMRCLCEAFFFRCFSRWGQRVPGTLRASSTCTPKQADRAYVCQTRTTRLLCARHGAALMAVPPA